MKAIYEKFDAVQFTENHKWAGCFGFIHEIKEFDSDVRYMIGVPVPQGGTAYIFSMQSKLEFEKIGVAVLAPVDDEEETYET